MICNVCDGTGFKNLYQIPENELDFDDLLESVPKWMAAQTKPHDVCVCDCCGDGENWYGEPGQHYGRELLAKRCADGRRVPLTDVLYINES
jgi:hypothetical protein